MEEVSVGFPVEAATAFIRPGLRVDELLKGHQSRTLKQFFSNKGERDE
jgi:hypothetical protein